MEAQPEGESWRMAREFDWALFEKAVDITTSAVRGTLGGENSQAPRTADVVMSTAFSKSAQSNSRAILQPPPSGCASARTRGGRLHAGHSKARSPVSAC